MTAAVLGKPLTAAFSREQKKTPGGSAGRKEVSLNYFINFLASFSNAG